MRELIPLALMLRQLAGSADQASTWLDRIAVHGNDALQQLGLRGDAALAFTHRARITGLFGADASLTRVRRAQLVLLLDILDALPDQPPPAAQVEPLVFTVPPAAEGLVTPVQRLDLLVDDTIARASASLHIGGPFWNAGGWDRLKRVVLPALSERGVEVNFYLHPSESGHLDLVYSMLENARAHGAVRALWWAGGVPSLMHAKFVISDRVGGYFGSANLTSLGLGAHLEMGVALAPSQAVELLHLLDSLKQAGLFTTEPPTGLAPLGGASRRG